MSDERSEQAWEAWWAGRGYNPAAHLAFNECWDVREAEVEALKAALRKARLFLDTCVNNCASAALRKRAQKGDPIEQVGPKTWRHVLSGVTPLTGDSSVTVRYECPDCGGGHPMADCPAVGASS
jgi:hypothetical protein